MEKHEEVCRLEIKVLNGTGITVSDKQEVVK